MKDTTTSLRGSKDFITWKQEKKKQLALNSGKFDVCLKEGIQI